MRAMVFSLLCHLIVAREANAEVAPEKKLNVFLTALGFNRTLAQAPFGVVLGVFGDCPAGDALFALEKKEINGKPFSVVKATKVTYAYFDSAAINVLYVCKISEQEAELLAKVAPRLSITVIADDPAQVDTFAHLGVRDNGESPRLRLNMKAIRGAKIEFDPRILGAAEVTMN